MSARADLSSPTVKRSLDSIRRRRSCPLANLKAGRGGADTTAMGARVGGAGGRAARLICRPLLPLSRPLLCLVELREREKALLARSHPSEQLHCVAQPLDVGDHGHPPPLRPVADPEAQALRRVGAHHAGRELVEVRADLKDEPKLAVGVDRLLKRRHETVGVVLAGHLAPHPHAKGSWRHVCDPFDHAAMIAPDSTPRAPRRSARAGWLRAARRCRPLIGGRGDQRIQGAA